MEQQNESRLFHYSRDKNGQNSPVAERGSLDTKSSKLADICSYVNQAYIIMHYRSQAAKELLEVFRKNLESVNGWFPLNIEIDEARFLSFKVGPMIFFYLEIPCYQECLVMLPARTEILERAFQWFAERIGIYVERRTCIELQSQTSFKMIKKRLTCPEEIIIINYWK